MYIIKVQEGHCRAWGDKRGVNKHTTITVGPYGRTGGVVAAGFRYYESGGVVLGGVVLVVEIPGGTGRTRGMELLCRVQDTNTWHDKSRGHSRTHHRVPARRIARRHNRMKHGRP